MTEPPKTGISHRRGHQMRGRQASGRQARGKQAQADGRWAETIAVWRLRFAGYRILARNWRSPVGEIDIVARKGNILAIVEVKSRTALAGALAALSPRQQARLTRAALAFQAQRRDCLGLQLRFDVIAIGGGEDGGARRHIWPHHIKQAWRPAAD